MCLPNLCDYLPKLCDYPTFVSKQFECLPKKGIQQKKGTDLLTNSFSNSNIQVELKFYNPSKFIFNF